MTRIRKSIAAVLAVATISTAGVFAPFGTANAQGCYGGGGYYGGYNGGYGRPYHGGYYKPYVQRHCKWVRVPYRWDYYGRPIGWRKVKRCW